MNLSLPEAGGRNPPSPFKVEKLLARRKNVWGVNRKASRNSLRALPPAPPRQNCAGVRLDSLCAPYFYIRWEVKPGGSFVPKVPSIVQREAQERDREQHTHQRKWEVKFAPQLATASRRTIVTDADVNDYINEITSSTELRTAMGGGGGGAQHHHQEKKKWAPLPPRVMWGGIFAPMRIIAQAVHSTHASI